MISGTISALEECRGSWPVADGERLKLTSPQFFENCPKKSRCRKSATYVQKTVKRIFTPQVKIKKLFDAAKVGHLVWFSRVAAKDQLFPETGTEPECV